MVSNHELISNVHKPFLYLHRRVNRIWPLVDFNINQSETNSWWPNLRNHALKKLKKMFSFKFQRFLFLFYFKYKSLITFLQFYSRRCRRRFKSNWERKIKFLSSFSKVTKHSADSLATLVFATLIKSGTASSAPPSKPNRISVNRRGSNPCRRLYSVGKSAGKIKRKWKCHKKLLVLSRWISVKNRKSQISLAPSAQRSPAASSSSTRFSRFHFSIQLPPPQTPIRKVHSHFSIHNDFPSTLLNKEQGLHPFIRRSFIVPVRLRGRQMRIWVKVLTYFRRRQSSSMTQFSTGLGNQWTQSRASNDVNASSYREHLGCHDEAAQDPEGRQTQFPSWHDLIFRAQMNF